MTNGGHIIFLNGTSSAGKTSIARLLQRRLSEPYLHIALDAFLEMFPPVWGKTQESGGQSRNPPDGEAVRALFQQPVAQRLVSGYHHALFACAMTGNNMIVDHVLWEPPWLRECVTLLADFSVFFVGVRCPLDVLEKREQERGNRVPGLAHTQFDRVHTGVLYDLEVDTSLASPLECVTHIEAALQKPPAPSAFQRLATSLREK